MFKIGTTLKQIRKELNYHQIDLYSGIMSKSIYIKVEADSRPVSVEELIKFSERLGINFFEILARAGMNTKSLSETGKEKLLISKIFTHPDLFDK
ncbi:XRE family transcriptional regulator, partial [Enterococcus faecalis]|nr:XRE family transcriptional regulator [Enterococcus faecalis]